ncbi:hypothetical protein TVAG_212090 [Trichomonas vaginalis G3]|uniref:Protein kinase domain-containing protein n=1 Tax=Trichomonas vaginalis (strain ATCC PRA-98 / G3) TaxID=412133 RepID=A2EIG5_TRIV3|nr:regulation of centriole replication [Trichomonas vaginalis G3]EAY07570.1 hypothetical protein TVAG_212090 [Trichomonas vaginalis G3]KAI5541328.1 regulation of centriole replication [Trichomonas vaginalis G3]|eukprot:XP_001319793.1 hypothetical protein [Trichomonas vaginalis G3]
MNYRESEFFLKKGFVVERVIARGGNSVVYCVYSNREQTRYALKKFPLMNFSDSDLDHLASINNEHIVRIYQHYSFEGNVYILTEYCPSNLEKFIKSKEEISNDLLRKYINEVVLLSRLATIIKYQSEILLLVIF